MSEPIAFILPDWLSLIKGGSFLYPCAGNDIEEGLTFFAPHIDNFVFCDLFRYDNGPKLPPAIRPGGDYRLIDRRIIGDPYSALIRINGHRELEPSTLIEVYENTATGRHVTVKRRRGFGQYALLEFEPKSLSVFIHRGDSAGDGGSNVFYFADCKSSHQPISHLLTKLCERLTDRAIVLSDGSNTRVGVRE